MTSLETALLAVKALDGKKGLNIQVIEISDISVLADYMVIATGTSSTHVKALADEVEYRLDEAFRQPHRGLPLQHMDTARLHRRDRACL